MAIQQHPDYHAGFDDAQDGQPLFDDASSAYRAGWLAYWRCRDLAMQRGIINDRARPASAF